MAKHADPITKRLAENVFRARKIYRLSQVSLATLINVDPDTVRNWEACRRRPDHNHVVALAEALGLGSPEEPWMWFYAKHPEPASFVLLPGMAQQPKSAHAEGDRIEPEVHQEGEPDGEFAELNEVTDLVSGNIARARKAARLRQVDLAEALGVSQRTIVKWEKGLVDPTNANLSRMGHLLRLTGKGLWFFQDHSQDRAQEQAQPSKGAWMFDAERPEQAVAAASPNVQPAQAERDTVSEMEIVAKNIKLLRNRLGISQAKLAEKVGLSGPTRAEASLGVQPKSA